MASKYKFVTTQQHTPTLSEKLKPAIEELKKRTIVVPKVQKTKPNLVAKQDQTKVNITYTPIYNKKGELINAGGVTKEEVNKGKEKAQELNLLGKRQAARRASILNDHGSRVLEQMAVDEADKEYRDEHPQATSIVLPRAVNIDSNDPFLKYADTGEYIKTSNGLVSNPNWKKPIGLKLLEGTHNTLQDAGMIMSMLPNPATRAIGNSILWGQSLADAHQDALQGHYGSVAADVGFMAAPYGISTLYKYWKPAKQLQNIVTSQNAVSKRWKATQKRYTDAGNTISDIQASWPAEDIVVLNKKVTDRSRNLLIDWEATNKALKEGRQEAINDIHKAASAGQTFTLNGNTVTVKPRFDTRNGQINPPVQELADYQKQIESILGGDALVGGSTRLYGSGATNGIPHDLELLTTKGRADAVKSKIGAEGAQYGEFNGFAYPLRGKEVVFNSDGTHMLDVQVLGQDASGMAAGQVAHNYFSRLFPEKYKQLQKAWEQQGVKAIQEGKVFNTVEQPLPITAEELYTTLQKHPRIFDTLVAMDNYNGYKGKQIERQFQLFAFPWLTNRIQKMNTAAITSGWQRLKLTPREVLQAKKQFHLPNYLTDAQVESIVNQRLIADSFGTRSVFKRLGTPWSLDTENKALASVVAPYNGQGSGIGGNQLLHSSAGGVGGDVSAILNNRGENIKTFTDYMKSITNRITPNSPLYREFDEINRAVESKSISVDEGVRLTEELAKKHNIRGFYGSSYDNNYFGALQRPTIGLKNYTTNTQSKAANFLEVGGYPTFIKGNYRGMGLDNVNDYEIKFLQDVFARQSSPYAGGSTYLKYKERPSWVDARHILSLQRPEYRKALKLNDASLLNQSDYMKSLQSKINKVKDNAWRNQNLLTLGGGLKSMYNYLNAFDFIPTTPHEDASKRDDRSRQLNKKRLYQNYK